MFKVYRVYVKMQYSESTERLVPFFRKLADDIEGLKLTPKQMFDAGQMYMSWEFGNNSDMESMSEEEVKKYLFTGWYIYQNLPENRSNYQDDS
jgi:hypothetical protein